MKRTFVALWHTNRHDQCPGLRELLGATSSHEEVLMYTTVGAVENHRDLSMPTRPAANSSDTNPWGVATHVDK